MIDQFKDTFFKHLQFTHTRDLQNMATGKENENENIESANEVPEEYRKGMDPNTFIENFENFANNDTIVDMIEDPNYYTRQLELGKITDISILRRVLGSLRHFDKISDLQILHKTFDSETEIPESTLESIDISYLTRTQRQQLYTLL